MAQRKPTKPVTLVVGRGRHARPRTFSSLVKAISHLIQCGTEWVDNGQYQPDGSFLTNGKKIKAYARACDKVAKQLVDTFDVRPPKKGR